MSSGIFQETNARPGGARHSRSLLHSQSSLDPSVGSDTRLRWIPRWGFECRCAAGRDPADSCGARRGSQAVMPTRSRLGTSVEGMPDLGGVRAVVTGATSGLGWAMADALLKAGATVGLAARPGARLDAAVSSCRDRGLPAISIPVDVRNPDSVSAATASSRERLGGVDLVVNNAGIGMRSVNPRFFSDPMPFFEVPIEAFTDLVATNLTGYFLIARAFAPLLIEQKGRLVNISMNHATMCRRGFVPYGPARAGAEAMSRIMGEDLRELGVMVNILLPGGATETGMIPDELTGDARARLLPADIMGPPIVFLASSEAAGLTGERLVATEFEPWLASYRAGRQADTTPGDRRLRSGRDRAADTSVTAPVSIGELMVLRERERRSTPWKNGGGATAEVAVSPPQASLESFEWRLSLATISSPGAFSSFTGVDRTIVLLDPAEVVLDVDHLEEHLVALKAFQFPGDAVTSCLEIDRPTRALNVLVRRSAVAAEVGVFSGLSSFELELTVGEVVVIVVVDGALRVRRDDEVVGVSALDALQYTGPGMIHVTRGDYPVPPCAVVTRLSHLSGCTKTETTRSAGA
jgi:NAD(P)-dependent dehydrogenase (short-subunit alcohol dehydrogenase family)/environmental stress-induced protein Ves